MTPLIPQEIYLLERYSSLEYYEPVRDGWEAMVKYVEDCLDKFMRNLPPDYRSRPLFQQPDMVWGDRCLPNFRRTLESLNEGFIMLTHGDLRGLGSVTDAENDERGQNDSWPDWMDEVYPNGKEKYWELLSKATKHSFNINLTIGGYWSMGALSFDYNTPARGPLDPPASWPIYRLNPAVKVKTGQVVARTGIYLPEVDNSVPRLLIADQKTGDADVAINPGVSEESEWRPTTWTLVERVANSGGGDTAKPIADMTLLRCEAGHPCPQAGFWFTPAKLDSRRAFKQGEIMPEVETSYGATIWQWDANQ